ncbi:MAG: MBL fold metallo-hydrolase [Phycisphaerales bacterium]|jgi:L-ascorbate metabolism protein UlaG (beta-lactamase superfamily)
MRAKTILSLFLLLVCVLNCPALSGEDTRPAINVTYIVCEGFIIEVGDKKIMIDALPARRFSKRQGIKQKLIHDMEEAKSPFDNVDIMFVTHRHLDHFDPDLTVQYMETNQDVVLVCPEEVHNIIKLLGGFSRVEDRIHPVKYESKEPVSLNIKDVNIKALPLPHGAYYIKDEKTGKRVNYHADVENFGYLIDLNGRRILHTGDNDLLSVVEFRIYKLTDKKVDVMFAEGLFWEQIHFHLRRSTVQSLINPEHIVLMHLRLGEDLSNVPDEMKEYYPNLTFFQKPLEIKVFGKD